jgi:hypothetical protein
MHKRTIIAASIVLGLASASASAASCKHRADRAAELDAGGVTTVEIYALAGDLQVTGGDRATISATGDACVSKKGMLDEIDITIRRTEDRVKILAEMPDTSEETGDRWSRQYAVMDLEIQLPAGVAVVISDSSGELEVANLAAAEISDSSGGIEIRDIAGPVLIPRDSSGDINMERVGDVTIQVDSSGEIDIREAASVTIANDTSGDIIIRNVQGSVLIGNDSSGTISARNVGGDLIVENDTSGGIRYDRIAGHVSVPEERLER